MAVEQKDRQVVMVGVAQFRIARSPERMMTMALGSCLGIALFDATTGVGALAHAMHPRRANVKNNANIAKFVDAVIPVVVDGMARWGARRERIVAKIFGGARMFERYGGNVDMSQIGDENIVTARATLAMMDIPIVSERVGGRSGRTIVFDLSNGAVVVRGVDIREEIC